MRWRFVFNTFELEALTATCQEGITGSSAGLESLWRQAVMPKVMDPAVTARIAAFRGGATAAAFEPWRHHDTRCFAIGSLAMRRLCEEAVLLSSRGLATVASCRDSSSGASSLTEEAMRDAVVLRDDFEGRPHMWRVLEAGADDTKMEEIHTAPVDLEALLASGRIKPLIAPTAKAANMKERLLFNVSVSHQGPLVAVASHPAKTVGVDVMIIDLPFSSLPSALRNKRSPYLSREDWQKTAEHARQAATAGDVEEFFADFTAYFAAEEWAFIRNGHLNGLDEAGSAEGSAGTPQYQMLRRFYVLWTLKESYIKALGVGFGFGDLRRAVFTLTAPSMSDASPSEAWRLAYSPSNIALRISGRFVAASDWSFAVYDAPAGDVGAVVAVAEGPIADAAQVSHWGRALASLSPPRVDCSESGALLETSVDDQSPPLCTGRIADLLLR